MKTGITIFKKIFIASKGFFLRYKTLGFVLLALAPLAYLVAILYLFALKIQPASPPADKKTSINEALYQKVMDNFKQREVASQQEETKNYLDPFK